MLNRYERIKKLFIDFNTEYNSCVEPEERRDTLYNFFIAIKKEFEMEDICREALQNIVNHGYTAEEIEEVKKLTTIALCGKVGGELNLPYGDICRECIANGDIKNAIEIVKSSKKGNKNEYKT